MSSIRRGGRQPTRFRKAFADWEAGPGRKFFQHTPGKPNYVVRTDDGAQSKIREQQGSSGIEGHQVFPRNKAFLSQPVLSEKLKDAVWRAVTQGGSSIRQASVDFKMDMRRVGAVVRLKEIEKQWKADGKQLATVYSKAVMEMLPQTQLTRPTKQHEPINDLIVYPTTRPQIFWPVAESQHFTRVEAGKAFENTLLPAEARIPHPQLYKIAKAVAEGATTAEASREEWQNIEHQDVNDHKYRQDRVKKREDRTTTIQTSRWEFKFESVTVDKGSIGKFVDGIGQRYGVPHQDRKKGHQSTIPTKVDG